MQMLMRTMVFFCFQKLKTIKKHPQNSKKQDYYFSNMKETKMQKKPFQFVLDSKNTQLMMISFTVDYSCIY